MNYKYINTSETDNPPIIFSRWEVRNSSNEIIATLEDAGKIDFIYAFPYLDVFTVRLTVRDVALNEDVKIKTYIVDECPICTGGGGAPSGPAMAEKYGDQERGEISLVGISAEDMDECITVIKATKVYEADSDGVYSRVKATLREKK